METWRILKKGLGRSVDIVSLMNGVDVGLSIICGKIETL